ncbi:MAG: right-handed parallel beta-helix repeat-containing protein [Bacteroidota bacterium]
MKRAFFLFTFLIPFLLYSQEIIKADALVTPKIAERIITVGGIDADISGFNNQAIQFAIDAVAKTGGTVKLNSGIYEIISPVRMKSNVTLIGSGKETILKRGKGIQTKFIIDADFGELKLTVKNTDGFEVGMKIQVTDDENSSCWNVSTAYITDITDNILYINIGLIRDYRSDKNGLVSNASSVIEAIGIENVTISNLTADGNRIENYFADGCNSAGILILRSEKVTIDNVHVKDFNGEGISWQITENVTISNSEISGSGNTGLHPGTGSPFTVIEKNDIHHNDRDGLFICWRVYESRVERNKIHNNGRFGICTGHKDTDVIFNGNYIYNNISDGINLRGEREANAPHRNIFIGNIIENNTGYGFSVNSPAKDLLLKENIFKNSAKTQKAAIYIYKNGSTPTLENNQFDEHEMGNLVSEKQ